MVFGLSIYLPSTFFCTLAWFLSPLLCVGVFDPTLTLSPIPMLNPPIDFISISCLYLLLSVPVQSTYIHTLDFASEDDLYSGFHEDARVRFRDVSQYYLTFTSANTSMFITPETLNLQSTRLRNFLDIILDLRYIW